MSRMKRTSVMRPAIFTRIPCDLYSRNEGRWANAEDVGRRRCGNCWSKQAFDRGGGACCAQRGTIKALCWGTLKWQFRGRTKIRRCVQTERLLKTDLSLAKHRQPRLEVAEKYCQVIEAKVKKNESKGYIPITDVSRMVQWVTRIFQRTAFKGVIALLSTLMFTHLFIQW